MKIRKGALLKCKSKEEADQILEQLGSEGYCAVRRGEKYIRVTAEPDEGQRAAVDDPNESIEKTGPQ